MPINWQPLVDLVAAKKRFMLTTHVRPDGDGLGSLRAIAVALRQLGKQVYLVFPTSGYPARYDFLDPEGEITPFARSTETQRDVEVILIADTGTWNQLGDMADFVRHSPAVKVVIDHHVTQDDLEALRFVDVTAEATGRLAHEFLTALGQPMPTEAVNALFTAVAMDTGWFRHGNTTARTFALAADLTAAGAQPTRLYELLFERSTLGRMKLSGLVLDRLTLTHEGRVAWSCIRRSDYPAVGAVPSDSEDLVNWTLGVKGVEVGLLFMEQPIGGIKISFRSRGPVDVAALASEFGGGGHPAASGAIVHGELEAVRDRVLQRLGVLLNETTPSTKSDARGWEKG
ncbi:MAG: bifunctional oligoribonuclease/PAP phosphatase NrnA [Gemmatales bacterium]|nr:bifunctional oligoribonuclease/PAP phosphatase NrnA [Gemmatales bacterium]MDW8387161.1 bifunctional oligoribonuclease/PAP phosphatase NrnA [Gemmatales bacterium]